MPSFYWGPTTLIAGIPSAEKGAPGGVAILDGGGDVPAGELGNAILAAAAGVPGGVATLDGGGDVPLAQLGNVPSDFVRNNNFSGGNFVIPVVEADVTDGIGFVELVETIPTTEDYIVEVSGFVSTVQQNAGHSTWLNLSIDAVVQAFAQFIIQTADVNNGEGLGCGFTARFKIALTVGARTIRLRAAMNAPTTGTSTLEKTATSAVIMSICKANLG